MNEQLRQNKQILRRFMAEHYTDEKLVQLLDHARAGKLAYHSCCCFIGVVTANHKLKSHAFFSEDWPADTPHYQEARSIDGAVVAEEAYCNIGFIVGRGTNDARRIKILVPMILAELKRRQVSTVNPSTIEYWQERSELFQ